MDMITSFSTYTNTTLLYGSDARSSVLLQSQPATPVKVSTRPSTGRQDSSTTDQVSLSEEGIMLAKGMERGQREEQSAAPDRGTLNQEQQREVEQLKTRDREVRAHEAAHLAQAGGHAAGGASFTYQQGPDGQRYAIGGEVPIDVSAAETPEATIQKMQVIRRAALAPANPSGADRNIAAKAAQQETAARLEMQQETQSTGPEGDTTSPATATDQAQANAEARLDVIA